MIFIANDKMIFSEEGKYLRMHSINKSEDSGQLDCGSAPDFASILVSI